MEVSSKLQHVLELWGPCLLESLSEKLQAGKKSALEPSMSDSY